MMGQTYGCFTAPSTVNLPPPCDVGARYSYRMNNSDIIERLRARMAELGVKPQTVSMQATNSTDTVRNWLRHHDEGKRFTMRPDKLAAVADALGVTYSWLLFGSDEASDATPGMAEPTSAYSARPNEGQAVRALYAGTARTPQIVRRMLVDMPAFQLSAGDLLVADLGREAQPGELVLVWIEDGRNGGTTEIRRFLPPYLLSASHNFQDAPLRTDSPEAIVRYPVIGVIRGNSPPAEGTQH